MAKIEKVAMCDDCEWSQITHGEREMNLLSTLHILTKHPNEYYDRTGKDPTVAIRRYAEEIKGLRRML